MGALGDGEGAPSPPSDPVLTVADGLDIIDENDLVILPDAAVGPSDNKVFQDFTVTAKEDGGTVELEARASGLLFIAPVEAVPAVVDNAETPDVDETAAAVLPENGQKGLRDNPISRVDFYAAVNATDGSDGSTALKFIGSVNGASAGAEDYDSREIGDVDFVANNSRRFIYTLEMSAADFLAIVGGKGDYGEADADEGEADAVASDEGAIVAFAVKDNKGVALASPATDLFVDNK